MSQKVEKVQKGGRGHQKNQKVQNSKFGLFDKRGGGYKYLELGLGLSLAILHQLNFVSLYFPGKDCLKSLKVSDWKI